MHGLRGLGLHTAQARSPVEPTCGPSTPSHHSAAPPLASAVPLNRPARSAVSGSKHTHTGWAREKKRDKQRFDREIDAQQTRGEEREEVSDSPD